MPQLYVETRKIEARLSISHAHHYQGLCDIYTAASVKWNMHKHAKLMNGVWSIIYEIASGDSFLNIKNIILLILPINISSYEGFEVWFFKILQDTATINYPILCHLYLESMYKIVIAIMAYKSSCVIGLVHGYKLVYLDDCSIRVSRSFCRSKLLMPLFEQPCYCTYYMSWWVVIACSTIVSKCLSWNFPVHALLSLNNFLPRQLPRLPQW